MWALHHWASVLCSCVVVVLLNEWWSWRGVVEFARVKERVMVVFIFVMPFPVLPTVQCCERVCVKLNTHFVVTNKNGLQKLVFSFCTECSQ